MPNNTGIASAIIAIVMMLLSVSGVQLSDAVRLDVQNIIAEVIVLVSLAWTAWRHLHDKATIVTSNAQLVNAGIMPIKGPGADVIATESDKLNAAQLLRKATP